LIDFELKFLIIINKNTSQFVWLNYAFFAPFLGCLRGLASHKVLKYRLANPNRDVWGGATSGREPPDAGGGSGGARGQLPPDRR